MLLLPVALDPQYPNHADPAIQDLAATQQLAEQALVAVVQLTIELGDRVAPGNVAVAREIDIMCRDLTICVEVRLFTPAQLDKNFDSEERIKPG